MSSSGPHFPVDDKGRAVAYGYVITGDETRGYRARAAVPLTGQEVAYGCRELLFAETLADLCALAKAEVSMRSMVGQAAEGARQDGKQARGAELAAPIVGEMLTALGGEHGPQAS